MANSLLPTPVSTVQYSFVVFEQVDDLAYLKKYTPLAEKAIAISIASAVQNKPQNILKHIAESLLMQSKVWTLYAFAVV